MYEAYVTRPETFLFGSRPEKPEQQIHKLTASESKKSKSKSKSKVKVKRRGERRRGGRGVVTESLNT
jgi:hypothetical protein